VVEFFVKVGARDCTTQTGGVHTPPV
jgi:hypothetical protein